MGTLTPTGSSGSATAAVPKAWCGPTIGCLTELTLRPRSRPTTFSSLVALLPRCFWGPSESDPHAVNYHLWVGSADADVTGGANFGVAQSYKLLERATGVRASITLQGAAHGDFHNRPGPLFHPFYLPYASPAAGPIGPCTLGRAKTHRVMRGYLLPLVRYFLEEDPTSDDFEPVAKDFLWRQWESFRPIGGPVGGCAVVTMELKETPEFVIDDYESNSADNMSSSGGMVTFLGYQPHGGAA